MDDMTGWDALVDRLRECNPAEIEWLTLAERSAAKGEIEVDALRIPDGAPMEVIQARLETLRQAAYDHALPGRSIFVFAVYGPKRAVRYFRRHVSIHKESALQAFEDPYEATHAPGNVATPSVQTEAAILMREVVAFSKHMLGIMAGAYQHLAVAQNSHTRALARQVDEGLGREYSLVQQTLDNRQIEAAASVAVANSAAAQQLGGQFLSQLKELGEAYILGQAGGELDPTLAPLASLVAKDAKLKALLTDPKMRELLGNDHFRKMFIDYLGGVLDSVQTDAPPSGDPPHAS